MPLITVTTRSGKSAQFKDAVLAGVHQALVASGVPETDLFQRVLELDAADFRYHSTYPDLTSARGENFVLVEILLSVGRSSKVKRKLVADLVANLAQAPGCDPEQVMVVFKETQWENWYFGGGRAIHT